jgi:acetoin:2,6-dichlorophenolindophenol oxidoreductase subunit alpha
MSKERFLQMLETMLRIRRFEERASKEFANGKIPGFVHLYIGEEAVATGVCINLRKDDYVASTHRGHGHCIAKGADLNRMMAELFGKKTGYCGGKGGSMHIADLDIGILGASGIVGSGIPLGTGAGLSARYRGTDQVAVCFFGDGATNQGTFHESLNLASIWKLPVIYVCENNQLAQTMPFSKHVNIKDISIRATSYGIPGVTVDGMDVTAVDEAARKAVENARRGDGPTLLECKTYRYQPHLEGDGFEFRTKSEIEDFHRRFDTIERLKKKLFSERILTEDSFERINRKILKEIDEAVDFAEKSPFPEPNEIYENVYVEI